MHDPALSLRAFHRFNNFYSFDAHTRDPHEEVNDLLLVIGKPIGVELGPDRRVFWCLFRKRFDDPLRTWG